VVIPCIAALLAVLALSCAQKTDGEQTFEWGVKGKIEIRR